MLQISKKYVAPVHWRHVQAKRSVGSDVQPQPTVPPYRQQDEGYLRSSEVTAVD